MGGKNISAIMMVILAAASTIIGVTTVLLSQQLSEKIIENSPRKSSAARHFQQVFGRYSSLFLVIGLCQGGVGIGLLVVSFKLGKSGGGMGEGRVNELLSLFPALPSSSADLSSAKAVDPFSQLKETINKVNIELMEARKRERAVIERAVDVICIIDIQSKFVNVSKACKNAWGYEPQELEKQSLFDYLISDKADDILGSILGSANSIDKIVFECKLRKKNGDLMDVVWTGHWSASDSGLFCIVHDITERKKAEEFVKQSEERLRLTLEGLPAGVFVEREGVIEFANSEAARLFACSFDQLIGKKVSEVISERKPFERNEPSPKNAAESSRVLGLAIRRDSSTFPVEISENRVELAGASRTISVFLDKTAQEELERMKSDFIAMLTHDLKTPLTSIHGILALLEEGVLGQLTDNGREMTKRVRRTCKRLLRLINDMLDLEKINLGKFGLELTDVLGSAVIEHSIETVKNLADERKIDLTVSSSDGTCWADEDRLVQVMVNLLSNAIKYSPDSSEIVVESHEEEPGYLNFSITDKGRGIPEDKVSKVFDKFEQVEVADSKTRGGTGLGLAICQAIVQEHGGKIGVKSKFGEGSTFWFSIPQKSSVN